MSTKDRLIKRLQDGGFKAIIFDFDGTLVDISEALHKSVEEVFEYYKIEADVDKTIVEIAALLETMQGYPLPKIILQSYDMFKYITTLESLSFLKKLRVAAKMFSKFLTYAEDAPLFPNTVKLIKKLKDFYDKSVYVWRLSKKPDREELNSNLKLVLIGMFILGFIGFLISIIFQLLPKG